MYNVAKKVTLQWKCTALYLQPWTSVGTFLHLLVQKYHLLVMMEKSLIKRIQKALMNNKHTICLPLAWRLWKHEQRNRKCREQQQHWKCLRTWLMGPSEGNKCPETVRIYWPMTMTGLWAVSRRSYRCTNTKEATCYLCRYRCLPHLGCSQQVPRPPWVKPCQLYGTEISICHPGILNFQYNSVKRANVKHNLQVEPVFHVTKVRLEVT